MRVAKSLLAVVLFAIGLFGAPWWADLAAEPGPTSGSGSFSLPTMAATLSADTQKVDRQEIWVDVDQRQQLVSIYEGERVTKVMLASTGMSSSPTPNGIFRVHNRGEWFYSEEYQQGAYYWVGLDEWGEYLFHSVPYTEQRQQIKEEAALLGSPVSHGCIRLALEDAKWIYDHLPAGARVVIHDGR